MTLPSSTSNDPTTQETNGSSTPTSPAGSTAEKYHDRVSREFNELLGEAEHQLFDLARQYPQEIKGNILQNLQAVKKNRKATFIVSVGLFMLIGLNAFGAAFWNGWLEVPFIVLLAGSSYMYANSLAHLHQMDSMVKQLEHLYAKYTR